MIRRMLLLAVSAAAVVAFAVSAAASATPLVHDENEEAANNVTAVNENTAVTMGWGTFACATVRWNIDLTVNTTSTATGSGSGEAFGTPELAIHTPGEHCSAPIPGTKITSVNVPSIHLEAGGTGHASFTFTLSTLPGCVVDGTARIAHSGSTLSLVEGRLTGTPAGTVCEGLSGTISGDFELQDGVTVE